MQAASRCLSLIFVTLVLLQGCGPTTGGSGTGDSIVNAADFGARATSVCSAPFAAVLACAAVSVLPVDVASLPGSNATVFTGTAASGPFTLTVKGSEAELLSGCQPTRFDGEWGVLPSGDGRFFGSWTGPDRSVQRAQLWVQTVAGSPDALQLLVQDAQGRTLFGPLQVRQQKSPPVAAPLCP